MKITTIQDANDLGCCCPWPECPGNRWQHNDRTLAPSRYTYVQFVRPDGDDADDQPLLYGTYTQGFLTAVDGTWAIYQGWAENPSTPGEYAEILQVTIATTLIEGESIQYQWTVTGNQAEGITPPPYDPLSPTGPDTEIKAGAEAYLIYTGSFVAADDFCDITSVVTEEAHGEITATVWKHFADTIRETTSDPASAPTLQGSSGSPDLSKGYKDVTYKDGPKGEVTDGFSKADLIEDGIEALELEPFGGATLTTRPESSTAAVWPTISDRGEWPTDIDYFESDYPGLGAGPARPLVSTNLLGLRYKVGIPEDWEALNAAWVAWEALHAAWEAADPETRGDEPLRGGKRSVFECYWDEALIPEAWDAWLAEMETWTEADPETRGPAPAQPAAEDDRPSLIQEREWIYGGPGSPAFSDFFQLPPPSTEGKARPVNMRIICYHYARVGVKPTAHGEVITFDPP